MPARLKTASEMQKRAVLFQACRLISWFRMLIMGSLQTIGIIWINLIAEVKALQTQNTKIWALEI